MSSIAVLTQKFKPIWPLLDERTRRIMAANEAIGLGYGGVTMVHRACGLSRKGIAQWLREIEAGDSPLAGRIRRPGAGRKNLMWSDPDLLAALDDLMDGGTRGDPESPLRWICKSTRTLAAELCQQDHPISYVRVAQLLHEQNYSLQSNRKLEEGDDHPDRDAQFRHINDCVKRALAEISWIRSGFRLSLHPRWRKSLENRARVFESVQVETYPLPHRSATVIHCRPTRCFCAITLAKRTARCIATGVSSKTADCALLTPFNAPSFIWARSMTPSKRLGAKALRCSTRPLNGPNKSVYSPRTATSRRMSSTGSKSSCPN